MSEDLTRLNNGNFANRVLYLLEDSLSFARYWGFYMRDPEMEREQELRNKLTAIWLRALIDAIEGEQRYLAKYKEEAERREFKHVVILCERTAEYFQYVRALLSRFSKDEQIFLFYVRNSLVHGCFNAQHSDHINIKYFNGFRVEAERLDRQTYWNRKREFMGDTFSGQVVLDDILAPMYERLKADSNYWAALNVLLSPDFMQVANHGIAADIGAEYPH